MSRRRKLGAAPETDTARSITAVRSRPGRRADTVSESRRIQARYLSDALLGFIEDGERAPESARGEALLALLKLCDAMAEDRDPSLSQLLDLPKQPRHRPRSNAARDAEIVRARRRGVSIETLAEEHDLSTQRIAQIIAEQPQRDPVLVTSPDPEWVRREAASRKLSRAT